jgi:hypothetical protein
MAHTTHRTHPVCLIVQDRPVGSNDCAQLVHKRAQAEVPLAQYASNLICHEAWGRHPVSQRKGLAADAEQQISLQIPSTGAQVLSLLHQTQLCLVDDARRIQRVKVVAELAELLEHVVVSCTCMPLDRT